MSKLILDGPEGSGVVQKGIREYMMKQMYVFQIPDERNRYQVRVEAKSWRKILIDGPRKNCRPLTHLRYCSAGDSGIQDTPSQMYS